MLPLADLIGALDHASRRLTQKSGKHSAHIATIGSRIRELLMTAGGEQQELSSPAELFDLCTVLETDTDLRVDQDLAQEAAVYRLSALTMILHIHYENLCKKHPEKTRAIGREEEIVFILAKALSELRRTLPPGRFGPETLREILDRETLEKIHEFLYDLEGNRLDWSRFMELLPRDLRERFDAEENGIDIPEHIASMEQALTLLRLISERKGIPLRQLMDPAHFVEHCKRIPAFAKTMAFFTAEARKREQNAPQETPDSSPAS